MTQETAQEEFFGKQAGVVVDMPNDSAQIGSYGLETIGNHSSLPYRAYLRLGDSRDRSKMLSTPMTLDERRWWRKYNRYLNSRDWQRTRKAVLKRDGYKCRDCGKRGSRRNPLQADHQSYDAYNATGHTPVDDLKTLCKQCHEIKTGRKFRDYSSRRVHQLVGWIVILAAILAYAIIRG
jgi:5-methylcytosine-specific restriction endonuclease McrA